MINSDVGLFIGTASFFVGMFVALQVMVWRSKRVIFGGTRRFARLAMATCVALTGVVTLCLLVLKFNIRFLAGAPFVLLYTLSVLTPFLMPALLVIEFILVAECMLTNRVERGAWPWHLGAVLGCAGWAGILLVTTILGY